MSTVTTIAPRSETADPTDHLPVTRSTAGDRRALSHALRGEWIKLWSVRATKAVLLLAIVGGLLISWAVGALTTDEVLHVSKAGFYWTTITAILAAVTGILLFTSETQHGTLAVTLTARPARWVIASAKALTATAFALVLGVAGIAAGFGGAAIAGIPMGDASSIPAMALWALLYVSLSALLGLGVGMVIRHSAGAIAGLLVWGLVVEGMLAFVLPARVARFLPFLAGDRLIELDLALDSPEAIAAALTQTQGALVFGGYAVLALLAGTILFSRRDTAPR